VHRSGGIDNLVRELKKSLGTMLGIFTGYPLAEGVARRRGRKSKLAVATELGCDLALPGARR
jgi:hypothetical protein